jgi:hypothetical protein
MFNSLPLYSYVANLFIRNKSTMTENIEEIVLMVLRAAFHRLILPALCISRAERPASHVVVRSLNAKTDLSTKNGVRLGESRGYL